MKKRRPLLLLLALASALVLGCAASTPASVQSGSMARFVLHEGFLYALDGPVVRVYEAVPGGLPVERGNISVSFAAETLFPYEDLLFVGTRQGMLVYSLFDPTTPVLIGQAEHVLSCDPVVVENGVAYVTLRTGTQCQRGVNALLVFDVKDPSKPKELANHTLKRPRGLDIDGTSLFVADEDGLLVFDMRDPLQPMLLAKVPKVAGYDVIARARILFVSADDGLYQYEYGPECVNGPEALSRIPIGRREPRGSIRRF